MDQPRTIREGERLLDVGVQRRLHTVASFEDDSQSVCWIPKFFYGLANKEVNLAHSQIVSGGGLPPRADSGGPVFGNVTRQA